MIDPLRARARESQSIPLYTKNLVVKQSDPLKPETVKKWFEYIHDHPKDGGVRPLTPFVSSTGTDGSPDHPSSDPYHPRYVPVLTAASKHNELHTAMCTADLAGGRVSDFRNDETAFAQRDGLVCVFDPVLPRQKMT